MSTPRGAPVLPARTRVVATGLIVASVGLQLLATTRMLCPPRAIPSLARLRIACAPRLWPFVDYPMFSAPHRRGSTLAWIDARIETPEGNVLSSTSHEVQRGSEADPWDDAFERAEQLLRAEVEPGLSARGLHLWFERRRLVLTSEGLVPPPCGDCPEGER